MPQDGLASCFSAGYLLIWRVECTHYDSTETDSWFPPSRSPARAPPSHHLVTNHHRHHHLVVQFSLDCRTLKLNRGQGWTKPDNSIPTKIWGRNPLWIPPITELWLPYLIGAYLDEGDEEGVVNPSCTYCITASLSTLYSQPTEKLSVREKFLSAPMM